MEVVVEVVEGGMPKWWVEGAEEQLWTLKGGAVVVMTKWWRKCLTWWTSWSAAVASWMKVVWSLRSMLLAAAWRKRWNYPVVSIVGRWMRLGRWNRCRLPTLRAGAGLERNPEEPRWMPLPLSRGPAPRPRPRGK